MGCNSLIRLLFSAFSDYVSAPKPCNSVGFIFPHFTFRILISAPYKLLVIRRVWQDKIELSPLIFKINISEFNTLFHTCTPQGNSLSLPLRIQMVMSLERRGILAPLPSKQIIIVPSIQRSQTHEVTYEYMILTLDCRLRKMMIVPSNVLGYFLQISFYDHPMSLRMSRLHPTNRVTYQLMVWIALF